MSAYTVIDVEPDTDAWYEERTRSIGASDIGGVIGESHFGDTPLAVYLDKVGRGTQIDEMTAWIGHQVEPIVTNWVRWKHPELGPVSNGFMARSVEYPWLHASFDRVVMDGDQAIPLQLKSASAFGRRDWEHGVIPDYLAQEDAECLVMGAPYAYLAVWFTGSTEFVLYKLPARPERQAVIVEKSRELWFDHVVPRIPPAAVLGDDLAALYPAAQGKPVMADDDCLEAWEALKETAAFRLGAVKEWTAVESEMAFALELHMQDATELIHPMTNEVIHTWREDKNGNRRHYNPKLKGLKAA